MPNPKRKIFLIRRKQKKRGKLLKVKRRLPDLKKEWQRIHPEGEHLKAAVRKALETELLPPAEELERLLGRLKLYGASSDRFLEMSSGAEDYLRKIGDNDAAGDLRGLHYKVASQQNNINFISGLLKLKIQTVLGRGG